jgi:predicted deacylase
MRVSLTILGLLVAAAATAGAAQREPLRVGEVAARPGEKASGFIAVPDGADPGTRLPVSVVNGAQPGPVLALIAGTHGYEYTSIVASPRILAGLDPARMKGAVILVHMANPPAFYGRRIYYGPDGKNLNRMYPGRGDGTQSERIAAALTREVIDQATHLVDMHCGDGNESLRPYAYWQITGDPKMDEASRQMVLAFGLPHIVIDRDRPTDPEKTLYTSNTAVRRGKPAFTAESGGMGGTDRESVDAQVHGALSVVAHLGIMEAPSAKVADPVFYERNEVVRTPVAGVWTPLVAKAETVRAGALLGRVADPFGNILHEAKAPFAGEVLYVVGTPPVSEGEPVAFVAQPQPKR